MDVCDLVPLTPLGAVLLTLAFSTAIVDWSLQAARVAESTNVRRIVTGGLFAAALITSLRAVFHGQTAFGCSCLAVEGVVVVIALWLLCRCGATERVLRDADLEAFRLS